MRRSIRSILNQVSITSVAAGLGAMALFGGAAHASTVQQRAQAEMNQGMDYVAAWQAASRATGLTYSPEVAAKVAKAQDALNAGKDYVAAWQAGSHPADATNSAEQIARAQQAQDALNTGKDYAAAWQTTDEANPTDLEAARTGRQTTGVRKAHTQ